MDSPEVIITTEKLPYALGMVKNLKDLFNVIDGTLREDTPDYLFALLAQAKVSDVLSDLISICNENMEILGKATDTEVKPMSVERSKL